MHINYTVSATTSDATGGDDDDDDVDDEWPLHSGAEIFSVAFAPATNRIQQLIGGAAGSDATSPTGGIFAPLGLMLENAVASALARQLGQQQQQMSAQNAIRVLDPNQTADNVKFEGGSSPSDVWFM